MKRTGITLISAAFLAVFAAWPGWAGSYPDKPIRVIVPNEAGGSTDRNLRILSSYLERELGTSVAVLNVPGGGTSVGTRQAMDATPDGYTLLFNHQALLVAAAMGVLEFGPTDLDVAAQTGSEYLSIVVNASSPIMTLKDLVKAAKAKPDTLKFGVQVGAFNHFAALDIESATGADFRYVNTGGGGPTRVALLGEHIDVSFSTTGDIEQYVESGKIRVLAVMAPKRVESLPDVPTSAEAGYDTLTELRYWWWLPHGVPQEIKQKLTDALQSVMANPDLTKELGALDVVPTFEDGTAAKQEVDRSLERMKQLAAEEGLR